MNLIQGHSFKVSGRKSAEFVYISLLLRNIGISYITQRLLITLVFVETLTQGHPVRFKVTAEKVQNSCHVYIFPMERHEEF